MLDLLPAISVKLVFSATLSRVALLNYLSAVPIVNMNKYIGNLQYNAAAGVLAYIMVVIHDMLVHVCLSMLPVMYQGNKNTRRAQSRAKYTHVILQGISSHM